jgi:predicted aconitase
LPSTAIAGNHPGPARQPHGHRDTGQARRPGSRADHDQPISIDRQRWRTHHVDPDFADKANRLATGFENLGASPIFSCTPYVFPEDHRFGQDIVWAKSNAIVYANSVISARTNRHGDFLDVCAAITGRAPLAGFHLPENRTGSLLVRVPPIAEGDGLFYTALGYLVGKRAGDLVPVIDGIRDTPSTEDLKAFCAAVATSGPVGMFRMVAVTPEAPTREGADGGREPNPGPLTSTPVTS